ncbi:hypothetical protein [Salsipaludibacter albus]|uniref:hypothetical protein n=1 Tax=Salsipaludibacter albus TaxID=2849650 RepID=UPI001EE4A896|nr:hypothetical protein [Salsipaludibacter albus]MBY5164405.1 hypothetical protein [Salsipaludibacter albus]
MESGRDPHVVLAHVEGLDELQVLRAAFEPDGLPFGEQFTTVFTAAIAFYRAAIPLRALVLTDHELAAANLRIAGTTGLGPQLPVLEVAHWLEHQRRQGRIDPAVDVQAMAVTVCGTADYVATLHLVVDPETARATYGDVDRLVAHLLPLLVGSAAPVAVDD